MKASIVLMICNKAILRIHFMSRAMNQHQLQSWLLQNVQILWKNANFLEISTTASNWISILTNGKTIKTTETIYETTTTKTIKSSTFFSSDFRLKFLVFKMESVQKLKQTMKFISTTLSNTKSLCQVAFPYLLSGYAQFH